MSEFGVMKGLLIEMPPEKLGYLIVPQIHLICWTRLRVFKKFGGTGMWKCYGVQVQIGGP